MRRLNILLTLCIWTLLTLASGGTIASEGSKLEVEMFEGEFATVNSFIFSNGESIIVMDVQRKSYEAQKLVQAVRAKKLPVTHILITHGHTDHFTGMPVMREAFPEAQIVVANEDIRKDIKDYAIYMDTGGETDAEPPLWPPLKPKTNTHPGGFDYENWIHLLPDENHVALVGGGVLELTTDYKQAEAPHMTTVYSPDLNALFLSDFGYNAIHHWQGDDISYQDIANWREELLRIKAEYSDRKPTVYPGHGKATDMSMFDEMVGYIDNYVRITKAARTREEALDKMTALYPDYGEADFFLYYSVMNHVKET